ncbi:rhodanese-like domain-containing protein [Candidatus Xianfuyuplasma coldseepsis]|uniref:Rhodanese domain-containing protein n=1 Tax=Candidatus Xianfuyuplasma coldseepsis TaxID=2782163 RepID=A0A7L7KNW9_9MOLU|nr:rhodanese-like domain-containing protein [Xianfuyuplasma coldseepsis]QMS84470.1 hypothetical protein G4Z02_01485 [Xianfuyuplasma coldseepsis]
MRRLMALFSVFLLVFILTSCTEEITILDITTDSEITMANLDDYMFRDDVQYVDLRNFNDPFMSGTIDGFINIPFFDYLDFRAFDRNGVFEFDPDQIVNVREIERLFDSDKAIFLYADGCIRSGYVKDVLDYLGYERVFVLGGFYEYQGEHRIVGTGEFSFGNTFYGSYVDEETDYQYLVYGSIDVAHNIKSVRFDIIDDRGLTLRSEGYAAEINYNEQLTILENFILNQGGNWNQHYDNILHAETSGYDEIEGYELGFSENLLSLIETVIRK